eukprot:2542552-Amphidinium_carterae.1
MAPTLALFSLGKSARSDSFLVFESSQSLELRTQQKRLKEQDLPRKSRYTNVEWTRFASEAIGRQLEPRAKPNTNVLGAKDSSALKNSSERRVYNKSEQYLLKQRQLNATDTWVAKATCGENSKRRYALLSTWEQ